MHYIKKHITQFAAVLLATLIPAVIISGCSSNTNIRINDNHNAEIPSLLTPIDIPITTDKADYRDIAISSYYTATVVPYVEEYAFPISGKICAQHFELGEYVKEGDLLTEIDHENIDSQIESLEKRIESETAAINLVNEKYRLTIENLKSKKASLSSKGEIADINCDIAIYEAKIRQNNENLADKLEPLTKKLEELKEVYPDYFIYAPMSGQIVYIEKENANVTANRTTAVAVADVTTKYIQASGVYEYLIQSALKVYAIFNGENYDLKYVPYVYDSSSGRLINTGSGISNFMLTPANQKNPFEFGDSALLVIESDYISNVLTIPNTAINTDSSGVYVYLVSPNGAKTRQDIITGTTNSIYTVVIDGLKEGDIIYVPN